MITTKRFAITLCGKFLSEQESFEDNPMHGLLFADIDCAAAALRRWCTSPDKDWKIIEVEIPVY